MSWLSGMLPSLGGGSRINLPVIVSRGIATTPCPRQYYKKRSDESRGDRLHFRRVVLFNKRVHRHQKKDVFQPFEKPSDKFPTVPVHKYGTRGTGIRHSYAWTHVPEKVPQLIVPDLTDCDLKPYVSYRTKEIYQEELTAKDLFNAVYGKKILKDYKEGKLDEHGNALEPSEEEKLTPEEARIRARRTGSDIFLGGTPRSKKWNIRWEY